MADGTFELHVQPNADSRYELALFQQPHRNSIRNGRSEEWRLVAKINGQPLRSVLDQVLAAIRKAGYKTSDLSRGREKPFILPENIGVRLGLLFLAVKPLRKTCRMGDISEQVQGMADEEAYYWFSKTTDYGGPPLAESNVDSVGEGVSLPPKPTLRRKQYANPPLVEVFTEFFFETPEAREWDWFIIPKLYSRLRKTFPTRRHIRSVGVQFKMEPARGVQELQRLGPPTPRHQFSSEDGKTLVQVGENLLVVNQLPPYYGWERFKPLVLKCFEAYCSFAKPDSVARCALHYIDKVDVPKTEFRVEDYFNLYPVLPGTDPLTNLAMAFEVGGAGEGDILAAAFRQHPSANPGGTSFLLQFDYVATKPIQPSLESVDKWLETAHDFASRYFRSTITQECEKLFD